MFNFLQKITGMPAELTKGISREELAKMLKTNPKTLEAFESAYRANALGDPVDDNLFSVNAKQAANQNSINTAIENGEQLVDTTELVNKIVEDLVAQTSVWKYDGTRASYNGHTLKLPEHCDITNEQIHALPEKARPQLTGNLMHVDIGEISYRALLFNYAKFLESKNEKERKQWYHMFRQGLDILDLDPITYQMLGMNKNAMGYWLPKLVEAIDNSSFFKIPKTTIIKVPITMLQLTRMDYFSLTKTTLDIVDKFCYNVFDLKDENDYFIKTGTYSSKFDFRNAHVHGAKEVRELGEYLLFIHFQALEMASPLSKPCIYGVSTTNEWVVREFIQDKENNPCIYKGLPLHTEYRVFVDFDTNKVIGVNPYWDPDVMKQRFGHESDADSPHNLHDYVIYQMHEETLMKRYNENVKTVVEKIQDMLPNIHLEGQWSIDIMQNGDDFWIIDMALAENSAFYNCVPKELRRATEENWLPEIIERRNTHD